MEPQSGRKSTAVSAQLFSQAHRFDFFQAVRLLERLARDRAEEDRRDRRYAVGRDAAPSQEVVRLRSMPALSFPAGTVGQIRQSASRADNGQAPPEMTVSFLGLTGPSGVLPRHYSTLLIRRLRQFKDTALAEFLDLFNHRLLSHFYRAWEKYRLPFAYERARLEPEREGADLCTQALYCLVGMGTPHLRGCLEIDDRAFLYYAGHFAHAPRTAAALEALLGDYFELPICVEQFSGQWLVLSELDRSRMPSRDFPFGRNAQLGVNWVVGERVWDVQSKFRLRVGPLTYEQFRRLLPRSAGLRPLCQMTRTYVGAEFDFDVQLVLKAREVPWCRLSADGRDQPRLGWNTWVRCNDFAEEVEDAVFFVDEV
jgi:type VI secretion system protein ImpH